MSLTLIDNVVNGTVTLSGLTKDELIKLHELSVASGDYRVLKIATNNVTGIYDYNENKPYWLISDFSAPSWIIEIKDDSNIYYKVIEWEAVVLDDGLKLTHATHTPLLNAFKYWITATDNPLENGGKFKKGISVYSAILKIIALINAFLIYGDSISLSARHLSGVSDDFFMALLVKLVTAGDVENGVYDYTNKVKFFLRQNILFADDAKSAEFANKNPFITRPLLDDEQSLGLSVQERIKACYWLNTIGYYKSKQISSKFIRKPQGNSNLLFDRIYAGKIIPFDFSAPCFEELYLSEKSERTEFRAIPNRDDSVGMSENLIQQYIRVLKLLNVVHGKNGVSQFPTDTMKKLSATRVAEHVVVKKDGRFKTLPPRLVFNLIRECYEFTTENQDIILKSVLSILKEGISKSTGQSSNPNFIQKGRKGYNPNEPYTERKAWVQSEALNLIDNKLVDMGIKCLSISPSEDEFFKKRRNNEGLFDLYSILIGAIQVLTGVIMAKRQDELSNMKSHGNLFPNIDPSSEEGEKTDYQLIAKLKKSGSGGEHGKNATIKRPIPRSFALIIWKLEQFNMAAMKAGVNKNILSLFSSLNKIIFKLEKIDVIRYNKHLNFVCDYFETPLVKFENGELRRYYVRQHQLRRFFAMILFWSRGFDGLDSLRWMLGHTDIEHLYRYITENETGAVLNGLKAGYILNEIENDKLENIQELANSLSKHYGVKRENISFSTLKSAIDDYGNTDDYQTIPHVDELKRREELESQIFELLENEVITLEPNFFTVSRDGQKIKDFTLVLQVKELD